MYILDEDAIVEHNKTCRPLQQNVHGTSTFSLNGMFPAALSNGLSCLLQANLRCS